MFKQNASIHLPSSEVPVVGTYDVVVCGGGPAGLIAAVAAARGGAKTLLIERYGFLGGMRSEEHTSELQSLMRISYAVFCLKKKKIHPHSTHSDRNEQRNYHTTARR